MTDSRDTTTYATAGGIEVTRTSQVIDARKDVEELITQLDERRGVLLSSNYDYPGRYTRWDIGFVDPPLELSSRARQFSLRALNPRGTVLLSSIREKLSKLSAVHHLGEIGKLSSEFGGFDGEIQKTTERFAEEDRSRQPSVFSVLRSLMELFASDQDEHLGLYGAFGYDLAFQFEPIELRRDRPTDQRDLVLYLPDNLIVVDHQRERAARLTYEFKVGSESTQGIARTGSRIPYRAATGIEASCDHQPGEYADAVRRAREAFKRGDLFEVVLSQTFFEPCPATPAEIFVRLRKSNPAPYALFLNLGSDEYLVGASPEMYVRVEGMRVETCPISGTISRGRDAVEDAERIRELLDSRKDESELTMCTDVDRNDKSRICIPGSVRVIGRRQIELYSRLIHTVDHVEGILRENFDALDAFLSHTWAVTVTGAPKRWAIQRVENEEKSPRAWYGGAIGYLGFNGNLNTGLTLRTVRLKDGRAEVRAGATLLYDSDPDAEERETRVKASAFLDAVRGKGSSLRAAPEGERPGVGRRILLVDHQDSFVHTLANYLRQTGAGVVTLRSGFDEAEYERVGADLVVLSPGPGNPKDFALSSTIEAALQRRLPLFGVCLGLQGIVEYFGGTLGVLDYPMHGKPSPIRVLGGALFEGLPEEFNAGRYHSLYGVRESMPACLQVTAATQDGIVMAVEHDTLPVAAVQFHPESILTLESDVGLRMLKNAVAKLRKR